MRYYCTCRCVIFIRRARIARSGRALSGFCEDNHPEALCFEGMVRLMRRRNPDKGLKLIGDAAAAEDSGA
jgi:hypothetical protein